MSEEPESDQSTATNAPEQAEAAPWLAEIAAADEAQLQTLRVRLLGRRGEITQQLKGLGRLEPDQRREAGRRINLLKQAVEAALEERRGELERERLAAQLAE